MDGRLAAAALLLAQLGAIHWFLHGDVTRWIAWLADADALARRYWRWCVKDLLVFGLVPLAGLLLLGRLGAVVDPPAMFDPARALLPRIGPAALREMAWSAGVGLAGGTVIVALVARWRKRPGVFGTLGDVSALMPRGRSELGAAAVLSLTAGVTEELAFRLFLPLTLTLATGNAVAGFALAALIFGAMHRYQGWVGVLATTAVGLLLTAVYLATGRLWMAMACHTVIDLNGLVARPVLTGRWRGE